MNVNPACHQRVAVYPVLNKAASGASALSAASTAATTSQNDFDIDIQISNMLCSYSLPMHIDLRRVAMNTANVVFRRNSGVLLKQNRSPACLVRMFSTGKVCILGCRSEEECMTAARQIGRLVQRSMGKLNVKVRLLNYQISNILATCKMPFGIQVEEIARQYPHCTNYEPELSVGLTWRNDEPKATLRIHTTGSVTVTGATSEKNVLAVVQKIYPITKRFSCAERGGDARTLQPRKRAFQTPIAFNGGGPQLLAGSMGPIGRVGGSSSGLYTSAKRIRSVLSTAGSAGYGGGLGRTRGGGASAVEMTGAPLTGLYGDKMYFSDEEELYQEFGLDDLDADFS